MGTFRSSAADEGGRYDSELDCAYVIRVPLGNIVRLQFTSFQLPARNVEHECEDFVEVDVKIKDTKRFFKTVSNDDMLVIIIY